MRLTPIIHGGGHERGMRSGTLNVPGIVGLGKAAEIAPARWPTRRSASSRPARAAAGRHLRAARRDLPERPSEQRLPGNLNVSFAYVEGESLLMGFNGSVTDRGVGVAAAIAVSSGSACTSATLEPSYVLKALGVGDDLAHTSIRFGLGRFNTEEEIDYVVERVVHGGAAAARAVAALRDGQGRHRPEDRSQWAARRNARRQEDTTMAYSDKVLDHYNEPAQRRLARQGRPSVGTGIVGAPECGDVMKLQIKIDDDGVVEDAKFKTFGCGSAIASSSYVTELVKGKTVDEALAIKNTQIVEELSLPPVKIHCSVLAEDAIKAAIGDWKKKREAKPSKKTRAEERRAA